MKKVSCCLLGVLWCFTLMAPASQAAASAAPAATSGAELFKPCSSCHTATKRALAGKDVKYLLEKFSFYENGEGYLAMKKLFQKMSAADKEALAKFLNAKE